MSRTCPVCEHRARTEIFATTYRAPDGWPLPSEIHWNTCDRCGMFYADGDFDQAMLNDYYSRFYGYGINNPANIERLKFDAGEIMAAWAHAQSDVVVDFGGAGDDGRSVLVDALVKNGYHNAVCIGPTDPLPEACDVIYASHVIEHIYDLTNVMVSFMAALKPNGTLIIDGPDSTGLLLRWDMPMMDYNTKHINHFTLRNYLDLGRRYGFELIAHRAYSLEGAPAFHLVFQRFDVARASAAHVQSRTGVMLDKLRAITEPVNVWGMGDITWHLLSRYELDVLDYIDNDPAMRGQTFKGKPILERPTNDAPIVIMAQGQRRRLIENIRKQGITNQIVEI